MSPEPDEGVLDPWVADWLQREFGRIDVDLATEARAGTIPKFPPAPVREIGEVTDDIVAGVPIRTYRPAADAVGSVVYFHGGGFTAGSVAAMDGIARELTFRSGATVVSVDYRLSPAHPYPAALDDCLAVTEWATSGDRPVVVAGESAGGNLAAAVTLRRREHGAPLLAGQVLLYPSVDGGGEGRPSEIEFGALIVDRPTARRSWDAYSGGRDLDGDPFAVPLAARSLAALPPALVVLGGCDFLRDAGRAYAARLRLDGVDVTDVCFAGQPHGFMNFNFPAAATAFATVGEWLHRRFGS